MPDWDRICKKIVDGEEQHTKCRRVLSSALGNFAADDGDAEPSFFHKLMQGDPMTLAMLALPAGALIWYMYFYDKGPSATPQQVVKTT